MIDPFGAALARAIADVRREIGDPTAPVAVTVPSVSNAALLRRALADAGPFFAVWLETPEQVLAGLPLPRTTARLRPEPPGWLRPTVGRALAALADRDPRVARLLVPGWRDPLVHALRRLESEGIDAARLAAVLAGSADVDVDDLRPHVETLAALLAAVEEARAREGLESSADRLRRRHVDAAGPAPQARPRPSSSGTAACRR